ncbi:ATP-binding protein [Streptomyces sp. NBC_01465]|uniref:ATP-binding protein n=1 Tax=Streptomyces sp. NBC_01465 TaxID=2903878 RepID=UPI002E330D0C|nr:ATP-binding protein [Streptomyces sp. NBC_01465]
MTSAIPQDIEWRLPHRPRSVGRARTLLGEQLHYWKVPDETAATAVLLLSELLTNAVRHATTPPGREVSARAILRACGTLRIEVSDANTARPEPQHPTPDAESGRGLTLVAALATAWDTGPRPYGIGKTVWFELAPTP